MMEENKYEEKEEDEEEENGYYKLHDHQDIPFAKEDDFYSIPAEDPSKSSNSKTRNSKKNKGKGGITLAAISEENSLKHTTTQQLKPSSEDRARNIAQLKALKAKYSSRRVILPGKDKKKTPRCFDCEGFYHIQSDPINAYDGVGIICELCGKNRQDNPELLLEEHYYKCEDCENVDICTKCYHNEQRKLAQKEE